MEDLLVGIFFIIVVVGSLIKKAYEQKGIAEEQERRREITPDELPEATRRMLYGTSEAPERAVTFSSRQREIMQKEQAEKDMPNATNAAKPFEQVRQPVPAQRQPAQTQKPVVTARDALEQLRVQFFQQVDPQARPPQRPVQSRPQTRPAPPAVAQRRQAQTVSAPKKSKSREISGVQEGKPSPVFSGGLFSNLDDVRKGIIISEILGPPKAFQ